MLRSITRRTTTTPHISKRKEVEKSLANLVKVIEKGVLSDTVTERLTQLEEQRSALNDAIETENVRVSLCEDKHSIQAYFDKFLHADVNDPEIRDQVFEYFVDKVYLYDDKLVEMMGLIGMGNNPMVGATVACAVAVEEAMK